VVLSTKKVAVLVSMVVLTLGIGLMGAVGFASPKKDNDDGHHNSSDKGPTLTVLLGTREATVVDLGPRGPNHGDMRVVNAPVYNESGKQRIGRFDIFCVTTDPAGTPTEKVHRAECTGTFTLPGGEISIQGSNPFPRYSAPPPRASDAISGGTGKYAGVRGEVILETRANKDISTFHFID
jgi:hypothetical protein